MTAGGGGMKTHAETVLVVHVFTRRNGNFCRVLILISTFNSVEGNKTKQKK